MRYSLLEYEFLRGKCWSNVIHRNLRVLKVLVELRSLQEEEGV